MKIGPQIDPGVPWCHAHCDMAPGAGLHLTLKSGNFGTDDFFSKALSCWHFIAEAGALIATSNCDPTKTSSIH
jgi:hypothetical protein